VALNDRVVVLLSHQQKMSPWLRINRPLHIRGPNPIAAMDTIEGLDQSRIAEVDSNEGF
jgi:hypothetical protein